MIACVGIQRIKLPSFTANNITFALLLFHSLLPLLFPGNAVLNWQRHVVLELRRIGVLVNLPVAVRKGESQHGASVWLLTHFCSLHIDVAWRRCCLNHSIATQWYLTQDPRWASFQSCPCSLSFYWHLAIIKMLSFIAALSRKGVFMLIRFYRLRRSFNHPCHWLDTSSILVCRERIA